MSGITLIPSLGLGFQCPASPIGGVGGLSAALRLGSASLLLSGGGIRGFGGFGPTPVQGMIDNISVGPSTAWYFALTPFESIMLGIIILKIFLLRYLTILPVNLNDLSNMDYFKLTNSRKKRKREIEELTNLPKMSKEKHRLAETMFTVIRRLDMQDCLLRTLCELQAHSLRGYSVPREVKLTLSALSKSGWQREIDKKNEVKRLSEDVIEERPILSVFEEAVKIGWESRSANVTECMERYFLCPLTKDDIFAHFDTVKVVNVL